MRQTSAACAGLVITSTQRQQARRIGRVAIRICEARPACGIGAAFARTVAFAIGQPDDVDLNQILFRPTRQEI